MLSAGKIAVGHEIDRRRDEFALRTAPARPFREACQACPGAACLEEVEIDSESLEQQIAPVLVHRHLFVVLN